MKKSKNFNKNNNKGFYLSFKEAQTLQRKRRYKYVMWASLFFNLLLLSKMFVF